MTAQVLNDNNEAAVNSVERESLSLLASRIFICILTIFAVAFCLDFVGVPQTQQTLFFIYGVVAAALVEPVASVAYQTFLNNRIVRPFFMAAKIVGSLNAGGVVLAFALIFGDSALADVSAVIAIICGVAIGGIAVSRVSMPDDGPAVRVAVSSDPALSNEDRHLAAVHEAGHALALAGLSPEHRAGAFVQIGGLRSTFTNVPRHEAMWSVAPYRRAQMHILLAGPVATDLHFGASAEGGRQDLIEWRHKAMSVLTAERAEGWNPRPETEVEYDRNERLIAQIESEQSDALVKFFDRNRELYKELTVFLFENGGASEDELESFLAKADVADLT
jgi:hypothetical protein